MKKVNALLQERLKKQDQSSKMALMARQSAAGQLTSFSGIFSVSELNTEEKNTLEEILQEYSTGKKNISQDLQTLIGITSEVKAINNQAALLHGERIKKVQNILLNYREGAFTAWLIAAYGNRQTPYNFLQYYEFAESLPRPLRMRLDAMPRQAIYTLASRNAPQERKQRIIENYQGETKEELLKLIRTSFPLHFRDRRRQDVGASAIQTLMRLCQTLKNARLTKPQKQTLTQLITHLNTLLEQ